MAFRFFEGINLSGVIIIPFRNFDEHPIILGLGNNLAIQFSHAVELAQLE